MTAQQVRHDSTAPGAPVGTAVTASAPARPAVVSAGSGATLDHLRLGERAARLVSLLRRHGLQDGDVVVLLTGVSADGYELLAATRRAGLVLLPLDPSYSLEELAFVVNTSGARVLVVGAEHGATATSLLALTPYVEARYTVDHELPGHRSLALARSAAVADNDQRTAAGTLHHSVAGSGRPDAFLVPDPVSDALGRRDLAALLGDRVLDEGTVLVGATSLSDPVAAQLATAVHAAGGAIVVPVSTSGIDLLRACFEHDATVLHLTPRQAVALAKLDPARVRRLSPPGLDLVLLSVPGTTPTALGALAACWGPALRQVYAGPGVGVLTALEGDDLADRPGSVGTPVGAVVGIVDDDLAGAGTIRAQRGDGSWHEWGDRGFIDDAGHLHLLDRDARALEPGGELVVPRDLETALVAHPAVVDAAVVVTSEGGLRRIRAFVETEPGLPGTTALEAELVTHLAARVPASWVPRGIDFAALPRTATGKVDKRRLNPPDPLAL